MDEFIYHFETLVKERKGHILDFDESPDFEYYCAILPYKALIQKRDLIHGGIAIKSDRRKTTLSAYFHRQGCSYGMLKPLGISLFKCEFHPYELEQFVIDLFSQIEYLKLFEVEEAAVKFKEAKSGANPIALSVLTDMVNDIIDRSDTQDTLRHYIEEEDQKGLNPMGIYGKRMRSAPILDRYDAANAVVAMVGDIADPEKRWKLMELGGQLLWETTTVPSVYRPKNGISDLYFRPGSLFNKEE